MKRVIIICVLVMGFTLKADAVLGFGLLAKKLAERAIKAVDLAIQRQQNKVIWLQNAQKVLENTMSQLRLKEISEWTEKQREQYAKYYDELWRVKSAITYYQRVREITAMQVQLVKEYDRAWGIIWNDGHFTAEEKEYMAQVYAGILARSLENIEQISLVVNAFKVQMSDAQRLQVINAAAARVEENYSDLKQFNAENGVLRLQRAKSDAEIDVVKKIYGLK